MKTVIDRSFWGAREKFVSEVQYLPRFLVGSAPRYKDEYSGYFDNEPIDHMYGGWLSFRALLTLVSTVCIGVMYGPPITYSSLSICLYVMPGFFIAQLLALPFVALNDILYSKK